MNEAPVNLTLSSRTVDENSPHNTTVGILSSDDPDGPSDVRTYHVIGPANTPFTVGGKNGRTLLVNGPLDHETNPTQLVIVRAIDKGGLFMEKTFKITVNGEFEKQFLLESIRLFALHKRGQEGQGGCGF